MGASATLKLGVLRLGVLGKRGLAPFFRVAVPIRPLLRSTHQFFVRNALAGLQTSGRARRGALKLPTPPCDPRARPKHGPSGPGGLVGAYVPVGVGAGLLRTTPGCPPRAAAAAGVRHGAWEAPTTARRGAKALSAGLARCALHACASTQPERCQKFEPGARPLNCPAGPAAQRLNAPSATMCATSSSATPRCPCSRQVLAAGDGAAAAGAVRSAVPRAFKCGRLVARGLELPCCCRHCCR